MKTIVIVVATDGQSKVETNGFVGTERREASWSLETALGSHESEQLKGEFRQSSASEQQLTSQG